MVQLSIKIFSTSKTRNCDTIKYNDGDKLVITGCGVLVKLVTNNAFVQVPLEFIIAGGWILHCTTLQGDLYVGNKEVISHFERNSWSEAIGVNISLPKSMESGKNKSFSLTSHIQCCYLIECKDGFCKVLEASMNGSYLTTGSKETIIRALKPRVPRIKIPQVLNGPYYRYVCSVEESKENKVGWIIDPYTLEHVATYCPSRDPGHAVILGSTGAGKSTLLRNLAFYYARIGQRVLVVDLVGEHEGIGKVVDADQIRVPGLGADVAFVVELLDSLILSSWGEQLSPMMTSILYQVLGKTRNIDTMLNILFDIVKREERLDVRQSAHALINRLRPLRKGLKIGEPSGGTRIEALLHPGKPLIINLSKLELRARIAAAHLIIAYLSVRRFNPYLFIFIDEAHNVYPRHGLPRPTLVELAAVEARKRGIRLIAATAAPMRLSSELLYNAATIYALRQRGRDSEQVATLIAVSKDLESLASLIYHLPVGYAVAAHKDGTLLIEVLNR